MARRRIGRGHGDCAHCRQHSGPGLGAVGRLPAQPRLAPPGPEETVIHWYRIPTIYVAVRLLGGANPTGIRGAGLSAIAAAAGVVLVWRKPVPTLLKGSALVIATFLVTPYAWDYDLVALMFAAVWYWDYAAATGWRPWERTLLAALVLSPAVALLPARQLHLQLGPLVLWAAFAALVAATLLPMHGSSSTVAS